MNDKKYEKELKTFTKKISTLSPMEFAGLARLLNVKLVNDQEVDPETGNPPLREFNEVLAEIFEHFAKLSGRGRKNLLEILKYTKPYKRRDINGNRDADNPQQEETIN